MYDQDDEASQHWFDSPLLGVGRGPGVAQLATREQAGKLRFHWKLAHQDREELRLRSVRGRELVMPSTAMPSKSQSKRSKAVEQLHAFRRLEKQYQNISVPFGLLEAVCKQDARDLASQDNLQKGNVLTSIALSHYLKPSSHIVLFPMGDNQHELGGAVVQDQPSGLPDISVAAKPLRSGRTSILQLDSVYTRDHHSIIALRSRYSTKFMRLDVSQDVQPQELTTAHIQCQSLYTLEPRHTENRPHIHVDFEHEANSHSRALIMNTSGAVFEFAAPSEKAICRLQGAHVAKYFTERPKKDRFVGKAAFLPQHPSLALAAYSQNVLIADGRVGPAKSISLYTPEEALLYKNRIQDLSVSSQSSLSAIVTSNKLALLDIRMPGVPVLEWAHHRNPKTRLNLQDISGKSPSARRLLLYSRDNPFKTVYTLSENDPPVTSTLPSYSIASDNKAEPALAVTSVHPAIESDSGSTITTLFELGVSRRVYTSTYAQGDASEINDKAVFWDEDIFALNRGAKAQDAKRPPNRYHYDSREAHKVIFSPQKASQGLDQCLDAMRFDLIDASTTGNTIQPKPKPAMPTALEVAVLAAGNDIAKSPLSSHPLQATGRDVDQLLEQVSRLEIFQKAPLHFSVPGPSSDASTKTIGESNHTKEHHPSLFQASERLAESAKQMWLEDALSRRVISTRSVNPPVLEQNDSPATRTQVLGRFPTAEDTPALSYGLLGSNTSLDEGASPAAQLLLTEWKLGQKPQNIGYQSPYEPTAGLYANSEPDEAYHLEDNHQPTFFSQPLPSVRQSHTSTVKALRSVRIQEPNRPSLTHQESLPSSFDLPQSSQSQLAPPQVFSQIVPGQFGARQQAQASVKKKKRKTGF